MAERVRLDALADLRGVLAEMRSVYRLARKNKMAVGEAFVYSKMLRSMAEVMSLVEIESRLRALEGETAPPAIGPKVAGSLGPMMRLAGGK
jgi:hypothetical protein